jgi:hypothetical protein
VFNRGLDASNRAHLMGAAAPDNVLFRIETIDARLPPLDDGGSWPALLARYRPVEFARDFLVLRRRTGDAAGGLALEDQALKSGKHGYDKPVNVPITDGFVIAEITVEPSLIGVLEGAVYKRDPLLITLNLASGQSKRYRFIPSIGKIGVMISPLIENTTEFAALYAGSRSLDAKRVRSFSIAPDGGTAAWRHSYRVAFRTVTPRPVLSLRQYFALAHPDQPLDAPVAGGADAGPLPTTTCEGVIDDINGFAPPPGELAASGILRVTGWTARSVKDASLAEAALLVLTDKQGHPQVFRTRPTNRPDVAKYFHDPRLEPTGYAAAIDVSSLDGDYALGIAHRRGDRIELCAGFQYSLALKAAAADVHD